MRKTVGGMLVLGFLVGLIPVISQASVPPCDQYLEWCIWTWCPQNNPPQYQQQRRDACVQNWIDYCT